MIIDRETPLKDMTAGQLADFLRGQQSFGAAPGGAENGQSEPRRYVYGLQGIMDLFHVSNMTAQRYKAGIIKDAVRQYGKKIVVDADLALELFAKSREK